MRVSPKLFVAALALAAAPALAQLAPPPDYVAQQNGGVDCVALVGEVGPQAVFVGVYRNAGLTNIEGVSATFDFEACFRTIEQCERFVNEMRFDYPRGIGACRRPE